MTRKTSRIALLLAAATLLTAFPAAAKVLVEKKGERIQPTTQEDWFRHPTDDKYYSESWTAILKSDQGHIIYLNFLYTNIGVVSGRAGVNGGVAMPGKETVHFSIEHETDDYNEEPETGLIEIASNQFSLKNGEFKIKLDEPDVRLIVTGKAWMPGVKLYDGKIWLKEDKSYWMSNYFHVPRGSFEAELVMGKDRAKFKGEIYIDHLVQNKLSPDFSDRWWTTRMFAPEHMISCLAVRMKKDFGGEMLYRTLVTDRTKVLDLVDTMTLVPEEAVKDPKGHSYETKLTWGIATDAVKLEGTTIGKRLHDREAVMERLSWAQRGVAKMIGGNPITYRHLGEGDFKLTVGGKETPLKGEDLQEAIVME